jgi:hypothetical protein
MNPRSHPLWRVARLPAPAVLSILLVLTAVSSGLGLASAGRAALRQTGTGLWALELRPDLAAQILDRWRDAKVLHLAREGVAWDYAFIAGYTAWLSIACLAFARRWGWFRRWGVRLGWLALLVGGLDALENVGMLQMLLREQAGQPLGEWPSITAAFAWPKWILLVPYPLFLPAAVARAWRRELGARPSAARASAPAT